MNVQFELIPRLDIYLKNSSDTQKFASLKIQNMQITLFEFSEYEYDEKDNKVRFYNKNGSVIQLIGVVQDADVKIY
jgi:FPC/CPF motif-containing protein YcgG